MRSTQAERDQRLCAEHASAGRHRAQEAPNGRQAEATKPPLRERMGWKRRKGIKGKNGKAATAGQTGQEVGSPGGGGATRQLLRDFLTCILDLLQHAAFLDW